MNSLDSLDPGIRDVVLRLRDAGFETTDSGDGVSKPASERAIDCPHVVAITTVGKMITDAQAMAGLLGDGWHVEASYSTADASCVLVALKP